MRSYYLEHLYSWNECVIPVSMIAVAINSIKDDDSRHEAIEAFRKMMPELYWQILPNGKLSLNVN